MKKFTVLFTIAVLVGITYVIAFSHHENKNRSESSMTLLINTYDPFYTSATFESIDRAGTDGDGPLYSTASTWSGLSDDGYTWTDFYGTDKDNPPSVSEDHRRWSENSGRWQYKDYDKRFAVSSYAYVSCSAKGIQYKTTYTLYAEVHSDFQFPNVWRIHPPEPRKGSFADFAFRWGDVGQELNSWDYELEQTALSATALADGICPPTGKTHTTSSEAPIHANDLIIICDHCDDAGCPKCNDHRE